MTVKSRLTKAEARLDALSAPATGGLPFDLQAWKQAHQGLLAFCERWITLTEKYPQAAGKIHARFLAIRERRRNERFEQELEAYPEHVEALTEWHAVRKARRAAVDALPEVDNG